ncbi:zinc finger protein 184-like [Belonocnema kinseyi]|uniref:zinc finger protein 184-like n=1 Tax=Belonocnema kinseyi TaxID=2817044 RepID=UPI00143D9E99|nr:zinc finger protein 184-like [Belonocnema kinseyi]
MIATESTSYSTRSQQYSMPVLKIKRTESLQLPRTEESGVRYKCRYCKRNFGQRRSQIRHEIHHCLWNPQKTQSSEFKTHVCENCGSSYTHRRNNILTYQNMQRLQLKKVLSLQSPENRRPPFAERPIQINNPRLYRCDICGASYSSPGNLTYHKRHDCGRRHQCPKCGQVFSHKCSMARHLRKRYLQIQSESKESTGRPDSGPYSSTTSDNSTLDRNTLIEYEIDETLEIKEEIIQDPETAGQKRKERFDSKVCAVDTIEEAASHKKIRCRSKLQFPCKFCNKGYTRKCDFIRHMNCAHKRSQLPSCDCCTVDTVKGAACPKKFDCGATSQFLCKLCEKRKRKFF